MAIVQLVASGGFASENATLEERLAILEENLTLAERRLDVALRRTTSLIDRAEELEREIAGLRANLSRVASFAAPSAPESFYIERIRREESGNYTVILRWKSNPEYESTISYSVWFARKDEPYQAGEVVNQTRKGVLRARIEEFKGGEDIIFKIIGKNEAGVGKASYREARIQKSAPFLMSRIRAAAIVSAIVVVLGAAIWFQIRRGRTQPARGKDA